MRIRAASDVDRTFRRARTGPRHRPVRFERQGAFQSERGALAALLVLTIAVCGGEPAVTPPEDDPPVTQVQAAVDIASGSLHSCAIDSAGRTVCWGNDSSGQLGDGPIAGSSCHNQFSCRASPVLVLGEHVFTEVVAGGHQTCALTSSGIAYCWGDNAFGALGYGASGTEVVPGAVDGVHLFMTLSIGFMHACGLDLDGAAICWGMDQGGRLGQGTWLSHSFRPLRVVGDLAFTTIAAGAEHTCARASSGRIWCWGANVDGQLGDGTTEDRMVPNLVSGEIEFTQVAAGGWHTCGLAVGGSAYCWGQNGVGQLGDGTSALGLTRPLPTRVGGDVPFVTIAAGFIHACALDSAGQAYCWGGNEAGQLGDGTRIDRSSPVRVEGNHVFAELAPGDSHTCGRTTSNEVLCWGSNGQGQVGDGTRTGVACFPGYCRPLPTPVVAWTQS